MCALEQLKTRLHEWPSLCQLLSLIPTWSRSSHVSGHLELLTFWFRLIGWLLFILLSVLSLSLFLSLSYSLTLSLFLASLLNELYHVADVKWNLKFEIWMSRVNTRFTIAYSQHPHTSEWFIRVGSLKSPGYATTFSVCHNQAWNHTMFAIQGKRLNFLHQTWSRTPMYEPVLHSQVHCMNWHCIGFSWSWESMSSICFLVAWCVTAAVPAFHTHTLANLLDDQQAHSDGHTPMSMFPEHMPGQACQCFTVPYGWLMCSICQYVASMDPVYHSVPQLRACGIHIGRKFMRSMQ